MSISHAHAKIETKRDARVFLNTYCIELVQTIEEINEEQKELIRQSRWKDFFERGEWILGISDIYSNLCK